MTNQQAAQILREYREHKALGKQEPLGLEILVHPDEAFDYFVQNQNTVPIIYMHKAKGFVCYEYNDVLSVINSNPANQGG